MPVKYLWNEPLKKWPSRKIDIYEIKWKHKIKTIKPFLSVLSQYFWAILNNEENNVLVFELFLSPLSCTLVFDHYLLALQFIVEL